LTKIAELR